MQHVALVATGALAALVLAGCDSTQIASASGDRVLPTVATSIANKSGSRGFDSVSVRLPLQVHITASDNTTLYSVVTRVYAGTTLLKVDSVSFAVSSQSYDNTIDVSLVGVRSGQQITVLTHVSDGAGNSADSQDAATAFDPDVPQVSFLGASSNVIVGGTLSFQIVAVDTTGLSKIGYSVGGTGFSAADSTLFAAPLPSIDTVSYLVTIPANAAPGTSFTVVPFAENGAGMRTSGSALTVQIQAAGADVMPPLVYQAVPPRLETPDSLTITARDSDGLVHIVGFIAKNTAGSIVYRSADTLGVSVQQVSRRKSFDAPITLRGQTLAIIGYAIDDAGHTGYAVLDGATVPASSDAVARSEQIIYAYGLTYAMPSGSLGADIAVDTARTTVYVSNINQNELEAWHYGAALSALAPVSVGAMPWGMVIDNSNSLLLVANSGGTNISKVNLDARLEQGRVKTANEYVFDVTYSKDEMSGGFKFSVAPPIDYSDRPQYIAQSASGALYYSTRPTTAASPGTLRRIDDFLDARTEPRQIWQYGAFAAGHYVILNADAVDVVKGQNGVPDEIIICDHTPGNSPTTAVCKQALTIEAAVASLQSAPTNGNVEAVKDLDVASLALPDTNFVAVGGDRRRVAFGEGNTDGHAGRIMLVFDPTGTPTGSEVYSTPMEVVDLTDNASDQVFGIDLNRNSYNIGVHGVETFFADSSLRLQGKFATTNAGAGIAFHPLNVDENSPDSLTRVAFVASGDSAIQIVDSYSYRLRGRIPLRARLYGPLRAVLPSVAETMTDPTLAVKLFGLTPQGIVVIDVHKGDIDNARTP